MLISSEILLYGSVTAKVAINTDRILHWTFIPKTSWNNLKKEPSAFYPYPDDQDVLDIVFTHGNQRYVGEGATQLYILLNNMTKYNNNSLT